ncbi:MAG TPA: TIGR03668 family PPOX class F420-dependent oxidoreductase [Blastocatellia bacterium]|nr:TIGR03668 family PPOX class F420-dependent oxidoreductase [Blastocatellia bacterium]
MAFDIDDDTLQFIREHRVARLATVAEDNTPTVIPICYVFDGQRVYSPIDEKPKSVAADQLKRVRNIKANPSVALVIDDYSENWNELKYVLVLGSAEIISPDNDCAEHARAVQQLRDKYVQYLAMEIDKRPIIRILITRIKPWAPGRRETRNGKTD